MSEIETPPCEVCGQPAKWAINDLREGEPEEDMLGRLWATWRVVSSHHYCTQHVRKPIQYCWSVSRLGSYSGIEAEMQWIASTHYFLWLDYMKLDPSEIALRVRNFVPEFRPMSELVDPSGVLLYAPANHEGRRELE